MPKPKRPAEGPIAALARLTNAEIVRRIFPEASVDMPDGIPGRSWIAGRLPPKNTALDRLVETLLKRTAAPRILPSQELAERGIDCPYYAVRFFTVLALLKAGQDYKDYDETGTNSRITILKNQKRDIQEMILRSKSFCKTYTYKQVMQIGDPNWTFVEDLEEKRKIVEKVGIECFQGIDSNIDRMEIYLKVLEEELERISPGKRRPETWRYSFMRIMGGLYCTLMGLDALPDDGEKLNEFLTQATFEVGGDNATIKDWGQSRTLIKQFKNAPFGVGFDEGSFGAFSLKKMERIERRGPEIRNLYDIGLKAHREGMDEVFFLSKINQIIDTGGEKEKELGKAMLEVFYEDRRKNSGINALNIIAMKDRNDAPEYIIIREVIMKPALDRAGLNNVALMAQLGWQVDQRHEIEPALLKLLAAARGGDAKAVATLALALNADEPAVNGVLPSHLDPFSFMTREDVMYDLGGPMFQKGQPKGDLIDKILWSLLSHTIKGCVEADQIAQDRRYNLTHKEYISQGEKTDVDHEQLVRKLEARRISKTPLDIIPKFKPPYLE